MKKTNFLLIIVAASLASLSFPVAALRCTPAALIVTAKAEKTVESPAQTCVREGEIALHLAGILSSSLIRARGYVEVRFENASGKLGVVRRGPWLGSFSGLVFDDAIAFPPEATHVHILAKIESGRTDAEGSWQINNLSVSPGVVVTRAAEAEDIVTTAQPIRWRFSTVPSTAQGSIRMELRDWSGHSRERIVSKTEAYADMDFNALDIGYYEARVDFTTPAGRANSWRGSLVVLPVGAPPNEARFGMDGVLSWQSGFPSIVERSVRMMRLAGIGTVRDRLRWSEVQPRRGVINWGRYMDVAKIVNQAGLDQVTVFHDSPAWTHPGLSKQDHSPPFDDAAIFEFGRAYASGLGKVVRNIEYWNEPNTHFFMGYPFQYASGLKAFSAGVKSVDPDVRILNGSAAGNPGRFFGEIYCNGIMGFFDTRNQHYYGGNSNNLQAAELDDFSETHVKAPLKKLRLGSGCAARTSLPQVVEPVWMTEIGYSLQRDPHGGWRASEYKQAEYLVKAYALGFASGYERVFYFLWRELVEANWAIWGVMRENLSPRPAYLALALLTRHLAGASVEAVEKRGSGRTVFFRKQDGSRVAVAWGDSIKPDRFGAAVEIRDIFGKKLANSLVEVNAVTPLFLSNIDALPPSITRVNLPASASLRAAPPLRLEARIQVEGKTYALPSGNKIDFSVDDGKTFEITGHIFANDTENAAVECVAGPGLELLSSQHLVFNRVTHEGETYICRYRAKLTTVGKSYAVVRAKQGKQSDVVQIVLKPDEDFLGTNNAGYSLKLNGACPRWLPYHSGNLTAFVEVERSTNAMPCPVTITSHVNRQGNAWVFPRIPIPAYVLIDVAAIRLKISKVPGYAFPPTPLLLQLVESGGGIWLLDLQRNEKGEYFTLLNLAYNAPWAHDNNSRLDLDKVREIMIGWGSYSAEPGQRHGFSVETIELFLSKTESR